MHLFILAVTSNWKNPPICTYMITNPVSTSSNQSKRDKFLCQYREQSEDDRFSMVTTHLPVRNVLDIDPHSSYQSDVLKDSPRADFGPDMVAWTSKKIPCFILYTDKRGPTCKCSVHIANFISLASGQSKDDSRGGGIPFLLKYRLNKLDKLQSLLPTEEVQESP